tara:strand:+ start:3736 stop:5031 length:1296 start_codon:yes stop_codon:yes gene_type:complete
VDTVVACSTPFGSSALSVVRVSGPKTKGFINSLQKKTKKIKHNSPFLSSFLDKDGAIFDEGIINVFFGPNSYTGEDLAEISCHGNPIIVDQLISLACDFGCRTADPGEFTKRAYLNGKIDIAQAESVASLISSRSLDGAKTTYKNLGGKLSANISSSKESLISVVGEIEFNLDISEESLQPNLFKKSAKKILLLKNKMDSALSGFKKTNILNVGANVVIAGPTNAGKSTLFNLFLEEERAIISKTPGTTRDVLQDTINLGGIPVVLKDTAGIRKTKNKIERAGINKTQKELLSADLVLFLGKKPKEKDVAENYIYVFNKSDIKTPSSGVYDVKISALKGKNINPLKKLIIKKLSKEVSVSSFILTSKRQVENIKLSKKHMEKALKGLSEETSLELVVEDLNSSIFYLDKITKKTTKEDVLSSIFSSFCVGK